MSIQFTGVHKYYQDKHVLRGINLSIDDGTFLAVLGPSGCGKTTLLQCISGLTSIDEGKIVVDGDILSEPGREVPVAKRKIGMVFQDFALWPHMTVFEIVAFGLKLQGIRGKTLRQKVIDTLSIFHMQDYLEHYPHELSGGQKQRIAIARTIAVSPRLILMDEPLSALDNVLREEMRVELVRIFKRLHMTVIYVTHDQEEAMSMADEIVLLKDGQCEQIGTPEMLYKNPVSRYAAMFMGHANFLQKDGESAVRFIRPDDIQLVSNEAEGKKGKIIMRSYLGGYYRYFIKLSDYKDPLEFTSQQKLEMESLVQIDIPANRCFQL